MFRIAFDPDRPVIATSAFPDGTVAAGDVFDWKAKGLQPIDALAMFRSGLLTHPPDVVAVVETAELEDSKVETYKVTPGESVRVETPKQRRSRAR